VELTEGEISVEITPTTKAHKCDRCWKHFDSVNEDGICEMCAAAVAEQK
jgi:predicted amidophosphoribosyltransferase